MKVVEAKIIVPIDGTGISPVTKIEAALRQCEEVLNGVLGTTAVFVTAIKNAKRVKS